MREMPSHWMRANSIMAEVGFVSTREISSGGGFPVTMDRPEYRFYSPS